MQTNHLLNYGKFIDYSWLQGRTSQIVEKQQCVRFQYAKTITKVIMSWCVECKLVIEYKISPGVM